MNQSESTSFPGSSLFLPESEFDENTCSRRVVKRGKTRAIKSQLVLVWPAIGWKNGANFATQSQSTLKQN